MATYLWKISDGALHDVSMINLLINKQEQSDQRKGLIFHFCDTLLQKRADGQNMDADKICFDYDGFRYDPRQSMFMYALCVNAEEKNEDPLFNDPVREYKKSFPFAEYVEENLDLNTLRKIGDQHDCSPRKSMQDCQFSRFLPQLFGNIMNTYANMKLATIYGYKYVKEDMGEEERNTKIQAAIDDFSDSYFAPPTPTKNSPADNECGEAGIKYLSLVNKTWDKKHCSHPQTNAMMVETIKSTQRLIKDIDWLKADEIIANTCDPNKRNDDLLACAFSSHGDYFVETDWSSFQNLYLNELMYFSLFVEYYSNQVIDKVGYNPFTVWSISHAAQRNKKEYTLLINELSLHHEAAFQSMRLLSQLYTAYPLHVAMMAYLEDLQMYRTELVKLYTPLNQLYYLFRNVQACQD